MRKVIVDDNNLTISISKPNSILTSFSSVSTFDVY